MLKKISREFFVFCLIRIITLVFSSMQSIAGSFFQSELGY